MRRGTIIVAFTIFFTARQSFAADSFAKAYDATWETHAPNSGVTTLHTMSDGKGHMRSESIANGKKTISIEDYPNKVQYSILPAQKMYRKLSLKNAHVVFSEESLPEPYKRIGAKTIDGHKCHGWTASSDGATQNIWKDDDFHLVVLCETTSATGKIVTELTSFSAKAPAGDLTAIPDGCKECMP